jgi:hypothetical protein
MSRAARGRSLGSRFAIAAPSCALNRAVGCARFPSLISLPRWTDASSLDVRAVTGPRVAGPPMVRAMTKPSAT